MDDDAVVEALVTKPIESDLDDMDEEEVLTDDPHETTTIKEVYSVFHGSKLKAYIKSRVVSPICSWRRA
jgi:hypothetical protein